MWIRRATLSQAGTAAAEQAAPLVAWEAETVESVVGSLVTLAAAAMGLAAGVEASTGHGAGEEAGRAEEATPVVAALGAATVELVEVSAGSVGLAAQVVETVVQTVAAKAMFASDSLCRG